MQRTHPVLPFLLLPQGINVIQRSFVYLFKVAALDGGFLCLVGTTFYGACLWDVIDTWYIARSGEPK